MRYLTALSLFVLLAGCRSAPGPVLQASEATPVADAFAVVAEVDRLATRDLWPGFDPRAVPVAIYDGERTLLFRHPAPPSGFQPVPGRQGVWEYPGRYPSVTANTSLKIGDVTTATLMPSASAVALPSRAGVLVHETFHVFQRERHPTWAANEADLFTYPVDDSELLALRRMETEALKRALAEPEQEGAACWARAALDLRKERFARMHKSAAAYERGTEWNEGLASYVERLALDAPDSTVLPASGFPPEAVRQRSYAAGTALARLLDRFSSNWREELEGKDSTALDALLVSALEASDGNRSCGITPSERDRFRATATVDVDALRARRAEQRNAFVEQPGWKVIVTAAGAPLFPKGFDPMNVQTVRPGEVLHKRWVKLGNEAGSVEVIDRAALSEAAGEHPLFNGVRRLTVTGFAGEPVATEAEGVLVVKADGISAELRGATLERIGQTLTIRLP